MPTSSVLDSWLVDTCAVGTSELDRPCSRHLPETRRNDTRTPTFVLGHFGFQLSRTHVDSYRVIVQRLKYVSKSTQVLMLFTYLKLVNVRSLGKLQLAGCLIYARALTEY